MDLQNKVSLNHSTNQLVFGNRYYDLNTNESKDYVPLLDLRSQEFSENKPIEKHLHYITSCYFTNDGKLYVCVTYFSNDDDDIPFYINGRGGHCTCAICRVHLTPDEEQNLHTTKTTTKDKTKITKEYNQIFADRECRQRLEVLHNGAQLCGIMNRDKTLVIMDHEKNIILHHISDGTEETLHNPDTVLWEHNTVIQLPGSKKKEYGLWCFGPIHDSLLHILPHQSCAYKIPLFDIETGKSLELKDCIVETMLSNNGENSRLFCQSFTTNTIYEMIPIDETDLSQGLNVINLVPNLAFQIQPQPHLSIFDHQLLFASRNQMILLSPPLVENRQIKKFQRDWDSKTFVSKTHDCELAKLSQLNLIHDSQIISFFNNESYKNIQFKPFSQIFDQPLKPLNQVFDMDEYIQESQYQCYQPSPNQLDSGTLTNMADYERCQDFVSNSRSSTIYAPASDFQAFKIVAGINCNQGKLRDQLASVRSSNYREIEFSDLADNLGAPIYFVDSPDSKQITIGSILDPECKRRSDDAYLIITKAYDYQIFGGQSILRSDFENKNNWLGIVEWDLELSKEHQRCMNIDAEKSKDCQEPTQGIEGPDSFRVESNKLAILDPRHASIPWMIIFVPNVKNGVWKQNELDVDDAIAQLIAYHEDYENTGIESDWSVPEGVDEMGMNEFEDNEKLSNGWYKIKYGVGVDSARVMIIDAEHLNDDSVVPRNYKRSTPWEQHFRFDSNESAWGEMIEDMTETDNCGIVPYGCCSYSGYGDGSYLAMLRLNHDKSAVIAVRVVFIADVDDSIESEREMDQENLV